MPVIPRSIVDFPDGVLAFSMQLILIALGMFRLESCCWRCTPERIVRAINPTTFSQPDRWSPKRWLAAVSCASHLLSPMAVGSPAQRRPLCPSSTIPLPVYVIHAGEEPARDWISQNLGGPLLYRNVVVCFPHVWHSRMDGLTRNAKRYSAISPFTPAYIRGFSTNAMASSNCDAVSHPREGYHLPPRPPPPSAPPPGAPKALPAPLV